jgi:hypothetical protein
MSPRLLGLLLCLLTAACVQAPRQPAVEGPATEGWQAVPLPGKSNTEYRWVQKEGRQAIAAASDASASMLRKRVSREAQALANPATLPEIDPLADSIADVTRRAAALGLTVVDAADRFELNGPEPRVVRTYHYHSDALGQARDRAGALIALNGMLMRLEEEALEAAPAPPAPAPRQPDGLPAEWDAARARARDLGARLWRNESDGTYTLSERSGHVPRTGWREVLARLEGLEAEDQRRFPGPPPTPGPERSATATLASLEENSDEDALPEIDALIAEFTELEDRINAGSVDLDDRNALERIADRADAIGAVSLGTRAAGLLAALGAAQAPLPAGWAWRDNIPVNPSDPRPLYAARRVADGHAARASHDRAEATQNAEWSERRHPLPAPTSDGADALAAMAAQARAELTARAAAIGYSLTWLASGAARIVEMATGAPFGGAADLAGAAKRVAALEARAAEVAATAPVVEPVGPVEPASSVTLVAGDRPVALIEDEDGDPVVSVSAQGLDPVVAEAIAQITEALRLLALGQAHAIDTPLLDHLSQRIDQMTGAGCGTIAEVLGLLAVDADAVAARGA